MHLYLTYRGQVIELLYPSLATLAVVTDQLDCLKSRYPEFSEIRVAYTELEADEVDYAADLVDEAISYLRSIHDQIDDKLKESLEKLGQSISEELDVSNMMLLCNHRNLDLSMKIAGRRNVFKIKPIENDRVSVEHAVQSFGSTDKHEFDSAEELTKHLKDLQQLEKRAKELFFSGTVFTSAYEVQKDRLFKRRISNAKIRF